MTYPAVDPRLIVDPGFWELPPEARADICNGCGAKGGLSALLVPDCIIGADASLACDIHDYAYWLGRDKAAADRAFLHNLLALCWCDNTLLFLARAKVCVMYYEAVVACGQDSFGHK